MLINNQNNVNEFDVQLLRDIYHFRYTKIISALQHDDLHKAADSYGATLLHFATADGNHRIMKHLIKMGANVNAQDHYGTTPLMLTLTKKRFLTVKILLEADASIYLLNSEGQSALEIALHDDSVNWDILRLFIGRVKKDYANIDDVVPILSAVNCPLYHAMHWKNTSVTRSRLEAGCSVHSADPNNARTALHVAVRHSDLANVEILLLHGANVNAEDSTDRTPLSHFNANKDSDENLHILQLLLDRGAKFYSCDFNGRMQIYSILKRGNRNAVKFLLKRNIRLTKKDDNGHTPIHYIAENENGDIFVELQGKQFNANISNNVGCTPLHLAASVGFSKNIQFLLDNGAAINKVNCNYMTPLFFAVMSSTSTKAEMEMKKECIQLLLHRGADVQYDGNGTHTVFDIILSFSNYRLAKPILLHLVIEEKRGVPITKVILDNIESHNYFKKHLALYRRQLTVMQKARVYESVTLFKLVAGSDRQINRYARNKYIVKRLKRISNKYTSNTQCKEYLRKRVSKAIRSAQLKQQADIAIGNILNLGQGCYTDVVDRIVDYLSDQDAKNVLNVQENMN